MVPEHGVGKRRQEREHRKKHGIFYTPGPIAQFMVLTALESLESSTCRLAELKIVDPACGEGALLLPAYRYLCQRLKACDPASRLNVLRNQIFGIDLDAEALNRLRISLLNELGLEDLSNAHGAAHDDAEVPATLDVLDDRSGVGPNTLFSPNKSAALLKEIESVLHSNFRLGDAVAGAGWHEDGSSSLSSPTSAATQSLQINWSETFPQVKRHGGFDVVFANPPYRRERGGKLDRVGMDISELGSTRRAARMDLWHYFFHRSLDLLRPDGMFSLIVNSAWTTSQAGRPLIARLELETTPLQFVLLERAPVFEDVDGRHLILQLQKCVKAQQCQVWKLRETCFSRAREPELWQDLRESCTRNVASAAFEGFSLNRAELFQSGRLWLHPPKAPDALHSDLLSQFDVRQGIAENPPRITRRYADTNATWKIGQGVFLLSESELADLDLPPRERQVLRPYYEASVIDRYWIPAQPTGWLLYLTRETAPLLEDFPTIARHLRQFQPLLDQRRECRQGKLAWWHLHWPREERLFNGPKIFAVQMGRYPRFVQVNRPAYVGFSVNLVVENLDKSTLHGSGLTLDALTAILNSRFAMDWFEHHAKRRGVHLDITGGTLKQFPLPRKDQCLEQQLDALSQQRVRLELERRRAQAPQFDEALGGLERQINELIDHWFENSI